MKRFFLALTLLALVGCGSVVATPSAAYDPNVTVGLLKHANQVQKANFAKLAAVSQQSNRYSEISDQQTTDTKLLLAQGGMSPGPGVVHSTSGGAPNGPGDVVSGATVWWGLRAYNSAYATGSNPAIDVCDDATLLICSTINILANGNLDVATAAGSSACAVKCDITKWYDQTGNGNHVTQASSGRTVTLTFSCLGALPCGTSNATGASYISAGSVVVASPMTLSAVTNRTSSVTSFQAVVDFNDNNSFLGMVNSANTARLAGSAGQIAPTMADNAWHAMNGVLNGASSVLNVDGTETTGSLTTPSENSPVCFMGSSGANCGNNNFLGKITEGGVWPSAFNNTQRTNMNSNQHTYWGF